MTHLPWGITLGGPSCFILVIHRRHPTFGNIEKRLLSCIRLISLKGAGTVKQGIKTMGHEGLYVACPMTGLPRGERSPLLPQDWFTVSARPSRRDESPNQGPLLT